MMWRTMAAGVVAVVVLAACLQAGEPAAAKAPTKAVSKLVLPAVKAAYPEQKHFINKWLILSEFTFGENDFGGDPQTAAADKAFMPKEGDLDGTQPAPKGTKWEEKLFDGATPGEIDLGTTEHATAYAVAWLNCPEAISNAKLLVGSDDYIKVWIDGKLVHSYNADRRSAEVDQDSVSGISLAKGYNRIVVKCVNVVSVWSFYLRFTDKDGKAFVVEAK